MGEERIQIAQKHKILGHPKFFDTKKICGHIYEYKENGETKAEILDIMNKI